MESSVQATASSASFNPAQITGTRYDVDAMVLEATLKAQDDDSALVDFNHAMTGLSITAADVIKKLNELLVDKVPGGIESLKPEDHTAEKTSEVIVKGATAFFDAFAKKHKDLEGEELVTAFMDTIRGGIQAGYDDAYNTLEGLGAFSFDGVREGVEQTKILIEQKLQAFEAAKRNELGIDPKDKSESLTSQVKSSVLAQGGAALNVTA